MFARLFFLKNSIPVTMTIYYVRNIYLNNTKTSFKIVGDVVEEVRTVFERLDDTSIYIPKIATYF